MRPGDLVMQVASAFPDTTVADKKMLVLEVLPLGVHGGASVRTLLEGKKRWWHYEELEVFSEAR